MQLPEQQVELFQPGLPGKQTHAWWQLRRSRRAMQLWRGGRMSLRWRRLVLQLSRAYLLSPITLHADMLGVPLAGLPIR